MCNIAYITDDHFYQLAEMHWELRQLMPIKLSKSQSAFVLLSEMQRQDAVYIGLFKDDILVGFTSGYGINDVLYISALYVKEEYRYHVKKLMTSIEQYAIDKKYSGWLADSSTTEGKRVIQHFGAKEIQ